jgi:pyrimidine and pyridine-specific 5'-nucleotidase
MFIHTHRDKTRSASPVADQAGEDDNPLGPSREDAVDVESSITDLAGVWGALAHIDSGTPATTITSTIGVSGHLPAKFAGLATPALNPMSMQLTHEEVVVGCADGTI